MSRSVANMLLLLAGLVWGLGFIAQETAMEDVGPFIFMTLRFGIAALAVFPMAYVEHRKMGGLSSPVAALTSENWIAIVSVGVMFFLTMVFQQVGLLGTTVTNAGVLTGLYVVLTPLIAFFVLGHKQPNIVWPAALLAFGGIWLLGGGALDGLNWGDWLILCSAVFAALHVLTMGHAVKGVRRPATVATAQFAVSAMLSAIGFGLARRFQWNIEPPVSLTALTEAAPEILFAALFAGAFAFFLMALCQQYTRAADAAILMSSEALFAAAAGAIILGERLDILGYTGGLMLFAAIVITSSAAGKFDDAGR